MPACATIKGGVHNRESVEGIVRDDKHMYMKAGRNVKSEEKMIKGNVIRDDDVHGEGINVLKCTNEEMMMDIGICARRRR